METNSRVIDSVYVVELEGRLDAHQAMHVDNLLSETVRATNRTVVNLNKVHFIDSTGLSVLIKGAKHHQHKNGEMVLCELQQTVRIIFELTRLDKMFAIYPTETDAIQALHYVASTVE